jgi:hypothetical protein
MMQLHGLQDTTPEDLLQTWVQITQTLVSVGHAADLRQALNRACGNSHEDPTRDYVEDSPTLFGANSDEPTGEIQQTVMLDCRSSLVPQEPLTTAANKPQSTDGGDARVNLNQNTNKHWITNHPPTQPLPQVESDTPQEIYNEFMSIDDGYSARDTAMTASSPAESDANEFDDWLGVPLDLVRDAADLSKHRSDISSQSFEEIFAAEELLPIVSELDENTSALLNQGAAMQVVELGQISQVSTPTPSSPYHDLNPADQQATAQDSYYVNTLYNAESTSETQSQQSTSAPQGTKPVRTRAKRDLTETEISCAARNLIQGDSINFFINNYQLIHKGWISLPTGAASLTSTSPNELIVAAFDTLDNLRYHQGITRLVKRFAYVHLIHAINIHKAAARKDRCHSRTPREPGHGDTTIAIDTYLGAKGTNGLSRAQLLEHMRKGTRWYTLSRPHLIILSLYTARAETIMYVSLFQ